MSASKKSPAQNLYKINLLIHKGEQVKLYVKLIRWLLSSGRFIVVLVELVVIGAFVMRYKLDADLIDLQEKINDQIPYIKSLQEDEIQIRKLQFQLSTIKQTRNDSQIYAFALTELATKTPKNIKLNSVAFDQTQSFPKVTMLITGQTPSNLELSAFIKALQKDEAFTDINLTNISFEGQTTFTITGSLSGKGLKNS